MKTEFLVDIVPRDVSVARTLCDPEDDPHRTCAITSLFVADGERRWTLRRSRQFGADVLITPAYNACRTLEILARARLAGARLVHFPSEQFFSHMFDREKLNTKCARAYHRQVDAVLVWGEYYARRLVEGTGYPRERIYAVGSPRIEFARAADSGGRRGGGATRVLFISDFTLADLQDSGVRERFSRSYGVPLTRGDVTHLDTERQYMLETARDLAGRGGFEVRIRPHPGESMAIYDSICNDSELQFADPAGAFSADVLWSDVVVGYTSTAIFEVIAAGRPFLSLRRNPAPPEVVTRQGLESLYRVCSAEQLLTILSDPAALEDTRRRIADQAGFYINNIHAWFQSAAALQGSLQHLLQRPAASHHGDATAVWLGAWRSAYKYLAFRLFACRPWQRLDLPQPGVVRRRLLPAHSLTDAAISRFPPPGAGEPRAPAITHWEQGPWCWRPVPPRRGDRQRRACPPISHGRFR